MTSPGRPSPDGRRRPRQANVSGADYDRPTESPPPVGVKKVSIEAMDAPGVYLLAGDMLELMKWSLRERGKA